MSIDAVTGRPLVVARALSRRFGDGRGAVVALHDSNATVSAGDRIAVTGASGSGKSTLLHLLAGLDRPSSGTITWPLTGDPRQHPGRVGVVFQAPSLVPTLDVVENVELVPLLGGVTPAQARERAEAALAALHLEHLAHQLPDELSGGQAQRVAVARVLAGRPALVLADEPTGQLDHDTAGQVLAVLEAATDASGAALLVATHDPFVSGRYPQQWTVTDGRLSTVTDDPLSTVTDDRVLGSTDARPRRRSHR